MKGKIGQFIGWIAVAAAVVACVAFIGTKVVAPLARQGGEMVLGTATVADVVFYLVAALTVAGAAGTALSRNILYSAFGLLMALLGAGSLYVFLSADVLAVTQLLVYIGGVLVLILFAVMLTAQIGDVTVSNTSFGLAGGVLLFVATAPLLLVVAARTPWAERVAPALAPSTAAIGNAFLQRWLLPFELASLVLVATLVGAVIIARKELKAD